jgi:hypothetical protein
MQRYASIQRHSDGCSLIRDYQTEQSMTPIRYSISALGGDAIGDYHVSTRFRAVTDKH